MSPRQQVKLIMADAPLSVGAYGSIVTRLHRFLQGQGFSLPASEVNRNFFGPATRQAVLEFQRRSGLPVTGVVDRETGNAMISLAAPGAPSPTPALVISGASVTSKATSITASPGPPMIDAIPVPGRYRIQGSLVFDHGLPASAIATRLYDIGFAGQDTLLGETATDAGGNYSIAYAVPASGAANLQVRVVDPAGGEITISATKFVAAATETLNLVVPAAVQPLASELQRLSADLEKTVGNLGNLRKAEENAKRRDLTLLNRATRWDARLVALVATAAQQARATGLGTDVLYALYRVGLPTDPTLLATVPAATVKHALDKADKAGIANFSADQIAAAAKAFQNFATTTLLSSTAAGTVSNFNDLLISQIHNEPQRAAFANLYFSQPKAGANLWTEAAKLDIPGQTLNGLRLQGKLLYLTFNNNALAQALHKDIGSLDNLSQLADKDYHKPETWTKLSQPWPARAARGRSRS
jgi:peptidoglycan hydrolase-like protein with peptidoglycan-binding domain